MDIALSFITGAAITLLIMLVYRAQQKKEIEVIKSDIEMIRKETASEPKEYKNIAEEVKRTLKRQGVV